MAKIHRCPEELLQSDLSGQVYVVTGSNSGIGLVTVGQLARQGAKVVLACRNLENGRQRQRELMATKPRGQVQVMELDLADLKSVRDFASRFLADHSALQGLVNNAGIMNTPAGKTKNGFELQFGTNHLGHFLLTELMLPALKAGAPSRVVNLSSCFHDKAMGREGRIQFEDVHFEKRKYDGWEAYAQSKLANLLHAKHLARHLHGTGIATASVHPGWVRSNLIKFSMPLWAQNIVLRPLLTMAGMIEPWDGAQSTLFGLLSPDVPSQSGSYYSQVGIYRTKEACRGGWPMQSPNPHAHDDQAAARLYELSKTQVGL